MVKKAQTPAEALTALVEGATAKWAKQRRAEERDSSVRARRNDRLIRFCRRICIKEAAERVLPEAYMAASANGRLPANPRQIYYQARPKILELTGRDSLGGQDFCQRVLVDYVQRHEPGWDIVWDDRGHFTEPHTGRAIGLGTLAVRNYLQGNEPPDFQETGLADAKIKTQGPDGRFGALLFIEKEGFLPLFEAAHLAERYDIGLMSTKGMSVTAARRLVDRICGRYNIPLLILHDFDRSGFSISKTVGASNRRYEFENQIEVIDLGLRLTDIEELRLDSEVVGRGNDDPDAIRNTLRRNGATSEEIAFLMGGQRVELNAMTSDQFIAFVEGKLDEHGIGKVIPAQDRLDEAFRLFVRGERISKVIEHAIEAQTAEDVAAPEDLEQRVRKYLDERPESPWEDAVRHIAEEIGDAEPDSG